MAEANATLALIIDGDNATPKIVKGLLAEIANYGTASVKRVYGDWTKPNLNGWKECLLEHSIQPVQQFAYTTAFNPRDKEEVLETIQFSHREPIGSSTYPPPNDAAVREVISALFDNAGDPFPKSTLYIHIPFCNEICSFCGFNKAVSSEPVKERYVNNLIEEIARYGRKPYVRSLDISAVYFGGGTPNALNAGELRRILHAINHHLPIAADAEITCEGIVQNFDNERSEALKGRVAKFSVNADLRFGW